MNGEELPEHGVVWREISEAAMSKNDREY